jgi:hypothetical protein
MIAEIFPDLVKTGFGVYRKTKTINGYNERVYDWPATPHLTCSGVLRQLGGDKRFVSSVHGYDADFRFYADPPKDILPGDRITYGGKNYEVKAVNDVMETGELLQIDLQWISNDG